LLIVGWESSGSKYAWEAKILYQAGSMEQRTRFADRYLEKFEILGENSTLYPLFQSYLTERDADGGFNISSSCSVAWRYLLAWDSILPSRNKRKQDFIL
jgi:hypothetical protein